MTAEEIETRARAIVAEVFGLDPSEVRPDTSHDTVENWDSLQHLTLVLALEEEFDIQLEDEETGAIVTFPLITAVVRDHLGILEMS
jgi:acyl carrier protein